MSELKDYNIIDIEAMDDERLEKSESGKIQVTRVYIKAEVDKVIAEKDTKIIQLEALIENYNRISREIIDNANHQKYKRCVAMAEMCGVEYDRWLMKKANAIGLGKDGVEYYLKARRKCFHYMRWQPRWLKLAEQFKEAKCR